ncbi:50S ribosomal protein L29 [Candidatus Pacearchaeota archaeon RBG_19FT_COMBO_34_9]|nr:MAG: 50S ribosomal protein L29 [Candidatus Pacearchaeota archaeon RBG_19FT_COMBO_34_9]OGJ16265.1 MAG: 50S ribosomal protein L29 [Candidatus Pacearchaeota archaeon RBG_13_33_26]
MKFKDIQKMNKEERMKKIEELKLELIKAKVSASKAGTSKIKEVKRMIARILTLNKQENRNVENH